MLKSTYSIPGRERYTIQEADGLGALTGLASLRLEGEELSTYYPSFLARAILALLHYSGFNQYQDEIRYNWKSNSGNHFIRAKDSKERVSIRLGLNASKDTLPTHVRGWDIEEVYIVDESSYYFRRDGDEFQRTAGAIFVRDNDRYNFWTSGRSIQLKDGVEAVSSNLNLEINSRWESGSVKDIPILPETTEKGVKTPIGKFGVERLLFIYKELARLHNYTLDHIKPVSLTAYINDKETDLATMAAYLEELLTRRVDDLKGVIGKSVIKDGFLIYGETTNPVSFMETRVDIGLLRKGLGQLATALAL